MPEPPMLQSRLEKPSDEHLLALSEFYASDLTREEGAGGSAVSKRTTGQEKQGRLMAALLLMCRSVERFRLHLDCPMCRLSAQRDND